MMEISDPKNVEEHNAYMEQLLREKQLPQGARLLTPNRAFVLKTNIGTRGDRRFSQKAFIHVCGHDEIDKARMTPQDDGRSHWKVPYRMGKLRLSQISPKATNDSDGSSESKQTRSESDSSEKSARKSKNKPEIVSVVEVVFHSEAISMCTVYAPFKKMVCDIALEGVRKLLEQKEQILDRDYQVECGSPDEPVGLIMVGGNAGSSETPSNVKDKPDLYYDLMSKQEQAKKKKHVGEGSSKTDDQNIHDAIEEPLELELKTGLNETQKR